MDDGKFIPNMRFLVAIDMHDRTFLGKRFRFKLNAIKEAIEKNKFSGLNAVVVDTRKPEVIDVSNLSPGRRRRSKTDDQTMEIPGV